jgi:retron-type reverse transcriptase
MASYEEKERVQIRGKKSEWRAVTSGVPQGSVLGPILFILYINDIDEGILAQVSKFADDTKVYAKVSTMEEARSLQKDLQMVSRLADDLQR